VFYPGSRVDPGPPKGPLLAIDEYRRLVVRHDRDDRAAEHSTILERALVIACARAALRAPVVKVN